MLHILFDLHEPSAANCFLSQILPGYAVAGWNHHQITKQKPNKIAESRPPALSCSHTPTLPVERRVLPLFYISTPPFVPTRMASLAVASPSNSDLGRLQSIMHGTFVNDAKIADSDTQLLLSMDREMSKYESLTAKREHLQQELDRSSGCRSAAKASPNSKSMDPNFNHDFLTARATSPATRSSMRSLVDGMSPLSRKVLLESLLEKDIKDDEDDLSPSANADYKKKSPLSSRSKRKSPGKKIKITPPRVKLTTSPSRRATSSSFPASTTTPTTTSLTMADFDATTFNNEKGRSSPMLVASPTEIAAQQLTAEIGTLEAELEKLIESKAERQAEEAESEMSELSDASIDRMYSEQRRRGTRNGRRGNKGCRTKRQKKKKKKRTVPILTASGSMAGLGKAYGFEKKDRLTARSDNSAYNRRRHTKAIVRQRREKGWIVSGDRPPVSDQRRFVGVVKSKKEREKDVQKERELLANRVVFEYDEVQASKFAASAFGMSPRTARRTVRRAPKSRLTVRNIQKGRIGFTKTTANQKLRELEILRRKMSAPRPEYSSAEDRVFFLRHR